jgi:hypothetical protein
MLIGALSLVMQVCCGTSMKNSRRSTFTGCWMIGTRRTRPGPADPLVTRPSVKMTSRSYCRTMWIVLQIRKSRMTMAMTRIVSVTGLSMARGSSQFWCVQDTPRSCESR